MKPVIVFAFAATILFTAACGLSTKEKIAIQQAQQAKDDSIRLAQINQVQYEAALQAALKDSLSSYTALLARQQTALIQVRTAIYTANDEMTQIKGFHLGRLPQDRENQIQNQELKIQTLLLQQTNLQTAMQQTLDQITRLKSALTASR
jgi:hypothetical protein